MKAKVIQKILLALSQQKTVFLTSLLCFVFLCLSSAFNAEFRGEKNRILLQLTLGFFLACVFSVPGTFISLKFSTLKKYLIQLFSAFFDDNSKHQIGGYPDFTQNDARRDGDILLFQMDSRGEILWGDSGFANFFISPDDLKVHNFSNVLYNWDCY